MKSNLKWCSHCKEDSVKVKCYNKAGERKRVEYCINKGCGYSMDITLPQACLPIGVFNASSV